MNKRTIILYIFCLSLICFSQTLSYGGCDNLSPNEETQFRSKYANAQLYMQQGNWIPALEQLFDVWLLCKFELLKVLTAYCHDALGNYELARDYYYEFLNSGFYDPYYTQFASDRFHTLTNSRRVRGRSIAGKGDADQANIEYQNVPPANSLILPGIPASLVDIK